MFRRRAANLFAVAIVVIASGVTFSAAASTLSEQGSQGAVDLAVSTSSDGTSSVYTVNFRGRVTDHGWSHTGTLTGVGATWRWTALMDTTPVLSMTSDDGTVSGSCVGSSETADEVTTTALHMHFGCVLSHNGGTPWQVSLESALTEDTSACAAWTGSYVENDAATPQVNVNGALSYGDVQLGNVSSAGNFQYGPLRFSGQIDIGGTLYRGDLVSGMSGSVVGNDVPPLTVSGSSNGLEVTGTCDGVYDETSGQAGVASYEFTCSLAVGSSAPAVVSLKTAFVSGTSGCSYRDCWGDDAGSFIAG